MLITEKEPPEIVYQIPCIGTWNHSQGIKSRYDSYYHFEIINSLIKTSSCAESSFENQDKLEKVIVSINSFKNLIDNWDENGSGPINEKIVMNAIHVAQDLFNKEFDLLLAYPIGDEGIQIDAVRGEENIEVEVYENHSKTLTFDSNNDLIKSSEYHFDELVTI